MLLQIIQGLIVVFIGVFILIFWRQITDFFGRNEWIEKHLGPTYTYNMWKFIGILAIICGLLWAGGTMQKIIIKIAEFVKKLLYL